MMPFSLTPLAFAFGLIVGLATGWGVQTGRVDALKSQYAQLRAEAAERTLEAQSEYRARETLWQTRFDKETKDAKTRTDAAVRDAAGARHERDRMRHTLAAYRDAARAATDTGPAPASETTPPAVDVLADLFGEVDDAAGELAAALDLAHAAGITCERSFDALTFTEQPALPAVATQLSTNKELTWTKTNK